ncbi:MAG: hypothetical protein ACXWCZ_04205 [Flavisolibacter sp.]
MRKQILFSFCLLLMATLSFAQSKQKVPTKQPVSALKKLLTGTGLPFKIINDSLYVVPYEGVNIESYSVMVQKVSDLYIVYTNLTEILPGKIDDSKYEYLLQQNDNYDIIKIGMNSDEKTIYVRADLYTTAITTVLLTRVIKQVANVTNIIAGELL